MSISSPTPSPEPAQTPATDASFNPDQDVSLNQSRLWSRLTIWTLVGVTASATAWACIAQIDEAVQVQGQLEPKAAVKDVQAPVGGVLERLEVKEGQRVTQGQILARFNATTVAERIRSLTEIRERLVAENQTFRAQIGESSEGSVSVNQQQRIEAARREFESRQEAARLEASQLKQQQLQVESELQQVRYSLDLNQRILNDLRPLYEEGGIARTQYLKQEETVSQLESTLRKNQAELQRLQFAVSQAEARLTNTQTVTFSEARGRIEENARRIAEIDSQITEAKQTLKYQIVRAPQSGTVFDITAQGPGYVANTSEPLMKLVPDDELVARLYIPNKDIGFVRTGQDVDIRIDSYPFSEYGDLKGKLTRVGSDSLPPNDTYQYVRFPAEVTLQEQKLVSRGRELPIQSGMSVSASIRLRQRPVITLLSDLFSRSSDALKTIR
ncbi:HlyD family type I secretion periplasmic adaptor subunit [Synechococcus elongatus]|uniref:Hemolysin secretion protein-like n=2 Tax=Synechococcus elongatus TaxID=32046 RepID=Q31LY5_SYNE7|nr:HlyD family type I secretion periplasmic adaptor subunit [Synechococcus elongatus]ABB57934.1 hemolysin secretion protein-like [Synechococcus elongatus PCC 7942 = FACHB-805]AJD57586.1 hemolysin secretion protein D [Synechococcus elongatus UTEX 2973]MBD2586651.1 HlyD family type I secretion periplasmic adaptor subunit [Synechococcus elongatus FACHB-242]MBD2687725.1 HlyD family type I secretion periplasmic adaptor subunit [Synechococcus elongatus FACHB-1061]MBD2706565.1 HlyD family type I secr